MGLFRRPTQISVPRQTSIRAYTKRLRWKSQVFGPMYTGDSVAEWSNLQAVIPMTSALAATGGFSFTGSDIGGFTGNPNAELYTRWFQLSAATSAFFRLHSDIHSPQRDPWFYDETTLERLKNATLDRVRSDISEALPEAIRSLVVSNPVNRHLRYRLLPYWYHAFARYVYYGEPVIRPLWYAHIDDPNTYKCNSPGCDSVIDQQVLVGTDIMVRGVVEEGAKSVKVYFPLGTQWYSTTGELMSSGWQDVGVIMDDIPRYFRAGSIIPRKDTYRSSSRLMYNDNYTLYVYVDPESFSAEGYAYLDDTISYNSTDEDKHNFWKFTFENGNLKVSPGEGSGHYPICIERVVPIGVTDHSHSQSTGGAGGARKASHGGAEIVVEIPTESSCVPPKTSRNFRIHL
ncbi:hypothetical protein FOZ62_024401 [Perkinsus olseni]|uniref:Uncharacterized protein n=1 Tax=Perkinsus olseni TaxID=32597 RepID=A0A7J6RMB7_PEROL|nr:hypothetical protein FOZ62_024401 [Perkinsus olseni]